MTIIETKILSTPKYFGLLEALQFKNDFQALCELEPKKIAIDMSSTQLMTSAGLGTLVNSLKASMVQGIELVLWNVKPEVMSVLSMTKLNEVFQIETATSAICTENDDQVGYKLFEPTVEDSYETPGLVDLGIADASTSRSTSIKVAF
jgi:anti-anti-sigma factor